MVQWYISTFTKQELMQDIEVYSADDCQYRNSDCNSPWRHELHGRYVDSQRPALARPATHTAAGSILSPPGFQHEA